MNKSAMVLSVPHQLQGPGFQGYIDDPAYTRLVECLIRGTINFDFITRGIDFIFEEAGGRLPSTAKDLAESILGPSHYMDVDPPPNERPLYGIREETGGGWFDPSSGTDYNYEIVDEHRKREELWLKRLLDQPFEKGLVICGLGHGLSFPFRLLSEGVSVVVMVSYIPYNKLSTR